MHPACTQVPPSNPRSIKTTSAPARRPASAAATPAGPPPTTTRSATVPASAGRREGGADVDHSGAGQGYRRGRDRVRVEGQLPFTVQGNRARASATLARVEAAAEPGEG